MRDSPTKKALPAEEEWPHTEKGRTLESVSYNSALPCETETVSTTMAHIMRNYALPYLLISVLIEGWWQPERNV